MSRPPDSGTVREIKPFRESIDPHFLWLGPPHRDAFAALHSAVLDKGGLLLLTGDVGTGKTLLANALRAEGLHVARPTYTRLRPDEFRGEVARELGLAPRADTAGAFLGAFREFLHGVLARREKVLLVVDEAQELETPLLDAIADIAREGRHTAGGEANPVSVLLIGQTDAETLFRWCAERTGEDGVALRCHLGPLQAEQVADYVAFRLRAAGADDDVFSPEALREIARASEGIPRLVNRICDGALRVASERGETTVSAADAQEALDDARPPTHKASAQDRRSALGRRKRRSSTKRAVLLWSACAAAVVLALAGAASVYYISSGGPDVREQTEGDVTSGDAAPSPDAPRAPREPRVVPELPERTPDPPRRLELPEREVSLPAGRSRAPGVSR